MQTGSTNNLLADLPMSIPAELVTVLAENTHVRIERIVSTAHCSPPGFWYDCEEQEWVVVLKGEGLLQFENGSAVRLGVGDHYLIEAHQRHRVEWTSETEPTVWLAVYFSAQS